jgi:ABC-2 type transport system ATP-binding protein
MTTAVTLEFMSVSKWYRQVSALTDVSLECGPGVTGLVGQNGAGKSTLMKLACGLLVPSQGGVQVAGAPPTEVEIRRLIGYCPDLDRFYEGMTGRTFLTWMLKLSGLDGRGARRRAGELLDQLGLGAAMNRKIRGYSKGMRQRVKLAQALGHGPRLVLLDEPLTGLDPLARYDVSEVIRGIAATGGTVVVSSHVLHELQSITDRVLLIHQGRLLAEGTVEELRAQLEDRPRRIWVRSRDSRRLAAALVSMSQVSAVQVEGEQVRVETQGGAGFFASLTRLGAEQDGLITEIAPADDSLSAVFGYLIAS